jgi:flagellar biosynthesis protein FliP
MRQLTNRIRRLPLSCSKRDRPERFPRPVSAALLATLLLALASTGCVAEDGSATIPNIGIGPDAAGDPSGAATGVQLLLLLTTLTLAPALLMMVTSFTRIIIVLSLVRNAVGVPQLPPNQVLLGIAFLLTVFVMAPVWTTVNSEALQPYLAGEITQDEAMARAEAPVRQFMLAQTREKDLELFVGMSQNTRPQNVDEVPTYVIIPGFIVSELKTAFLMGFVIFVPFLIIDIVVSSALLSMGMMMLPPVVVSLPFKILLFVLVDGWGLIIGSLVTSFVV